MVGDGMERLAAEARFAVSRWEERSEGKGGRLGEGFFSAISQQQYAIGGKLGIPLRAALRLRVALRASECGLADLPRCRASLAFFVPWQALPPVPSRPSSSSAGPRGYASRRRPWR